MRCSCTHEAGDTDCAKHPACTECGASIDNTRLVRELRAALVEACQIADRHIFAPSYGSDPVVMQTAVMTVDSGAVYRDKARIAELLLESVK